MVTFAFTTSLVITVLLCVGIYHAAEDWLESRHGVGRLTSGNRAVPRQLGLGAPHGNGFEKAA